jgi:hypothetical protein
MLPPKAPSIAVAGFVCAVVGFFLGFIYLILPILGVVFSAVGRFQAKTGKAPAA